MGSRAHHLVLTAPLVVVGAFVGACYPVFRFDGGDGGAQGTSVSSSLVSGSSTSVRPTGSSTAGNAVSTGSGSSGTGNPGSTSAATSTSANTASSTTTGGSDVGAPCEVGGTQSCFPGEACCFELSANPTDLCVNVCETDQDGILGIDHLSLACNTNDDCNGVCCVYYTILGNLKGTWCQSSCTVDEDAACDPTQGGCASGSCSALLYDAFGGQPPPPYDAYGICL